MCVCVCMVMGGGGGGGGGREEKVGIQEGAFTGVLFELLFLFICLSVCWFQLK